MGGLKDNLIILCILIAVSFSLSYHWLLPGCVMSTHGDLENHFLTSFVIQEQLINYGTIYPVDFDYFPLGYYHFSYSPVLFLLPMVLRLFFNARLAFFILFTLFHAFSGFTLYLFLRKNKGTITGSFIFALFFLFSGFMNQQFTVHGSYHTIALFPFLFMTFYFLQSYSKTRERKHLLLTLLFAFCTIISHMLGLIILSLFFLFYCLFKKDFKLLSFYVLTVLCSSFYYAPLFFQSQILPKPDWSNELKSELTGRIVESFTALPNIVDQNFTAGVDFLYGPYLLIGFVITLFFAHFKSRKLIKGESFSFIFGAAVITLIVLFINISFFWAVPLERLMFFIQVSLFFYIAIIFSKKLFGLEAVILSLIGYLLPHEDTMDYVLPFIAVFFFIRYIITKRLELTKSFFVIIILLVLILPFTRYLPNSLNYPRDWCFYIDDISFLNKSIVFYQDQAIDFASLVYYSGAKVVESIGHTTLSKSYPQLDDPQIFDFTKRAGINQIIHPSEATPTSYKIFYRHILFDLSALNLPIVPVNYTMSFNSPVNIDVSLLEPMSNVSLRINYHPWWVATVNGQELETYQDDWFLGVKGLEGVDSFNLHFNTFYFNLGLLMSFISVLLLLYFNKFI